MKRSFLILIVSFTWLLSSCQSSLNHGQEANKNEEQKLKVTVSGVCGRITVEIPTPHYSFARFEEPHDTYTGIVRNEFNFVDKKDSGRVLIRLPIKVSSSECDSSKSFEDQTFEYLQDVVKMEYHYSGKYERKIIEKKGIKIYGIFFDSGFCLQGCRYGSFFQVGLENVSDHKLREEILNSIKIGED